MYTINKVYVHTSFISFDHRNIIRESITPLSRYTSTRVRLRAVASKKKIISNRPFVKVLCFSPFLVIRQISRIDFLNNTFYLGNSPIPITRRRLIRWQENLFNFLVIYLGAI